MYDIKWIRENAEVFDRGGRGAGLNRWLKCFLRSMISAAPRSPNRKQRKSAAMPLSKEIGPAMAASDVALAEALKTEVGGVEGGSLRL